MPRRNRVIAVYDKKTNEMAQKIDDNQSVPRVRGKVFVFRL